MTITLPREQQEWLEAQVKAGHYDSIEGASLASSKNLIANDACRRQPAGRR